MNHIHNTVDFKDFDISVVMSFYKKMKDFRRVLPINAPYFQRNGIEVIIALDEPTECEELIEFIKEYPKINWRVIVNNKDHEWRNPCKAWNVGIRHATKKYILVVDPECEFYSDVIYELRQAAQNEENSFFIGRVSFVNYSYQIATDTAESIFFINYGSILTRKDHIEQVCGYTESFNIWGGEDDNLRLKLNAIGLKKIRVKEALILHREEKSNGFETRFKKTEQLSKNSLNNAFNPESQDFINPEWGKDFSDLRYDYLNLG